MRSQAAIIDKLEEMLDEERIDQGQALRLTLVSMHQILQWQQEQLEMMSNYDRRLKKVEEQMESYPTLLWFIHHRRKEVIIVLALIFLLYTAIFTPVNFLWIRDVLLSMAGMPAGFAGP